MAYENSKAGSEQPAAPRGPGVQYVEAGEGDDGQRLDNFLVRVLKGVPRTHIYRLLRKGEVRVNSKRARPDQRVAAGDRIRLPPVRRSEVVEGAGTRLPSRGLQQLLADAIVYEDDDLIVLNKPAGVAVHGGSGMSHGVIEALRAARPEIRELDLVHRLDRETSGCLIVAKRRAALRDLHAQLREGTTEKRYLALVCGKWDLGHKRSELPLATGERRGGERHVAVRGHGQMAVSTFRPVQFFGNVASLVEVAIDTGKTHQIRVHAAYAGHPVAGDDKYGDREKNAALRQYGLNRMFLHAVSIGVNRPGSHEPLHVSAPLGEDLRAVLDALVKAPGSPRGEARRRARSRAAR
ncbi:MAG: RluA family pseudouridine synthase [Gammaproteobacteria bacterium]|nr:RluA family pseudouridine synthase [Gammaproteobacteria bacterium]